MKLFKSITITSLFFMHFTHTKQMSKPTTAKPIQPTQSSQPVKQIQQQNQFQWLLAQPKPWNPTLLQWINNNFKNFSPDQQKFINNEINQQQQPVIRQKKIIPSPQPVQPSFAKASEGRPKLQEKKLQPIIQPVPQKPIKEKKRSKQPAPQKEKRTRKTRQPKEIKTTQPSSTQKIMPYSAEIIKEKPQISPAKVSPATHNLIMVLDPNQTEKINNYQRAMVSDVLMGLYEQIAPIIMTSNVLEIITLVRQQIGETNLKQLRNSPYNQIQQFAQQLIQQYNLREQSLTLILMSLINFDDKDYYLHTSDHLALIIPQKYISSSMPNATKLNAQDQIAACGFNPAVLTKMESTNPEYLLQKLKSQPYFAQATKGKQANQNQFINHLATMFIPQKRSGQLINPTQDTPWIMYIAGHGGPTYLMSGNTLQVVPEKGNVVGISLQAFSQLMTFFDTTLDMAYIHYTTCFSGGYNQAFVNKILSSLDVDFIVSSEGLGEKETTTIPIAMRFSSVQPYISLQYSPFTDFFTQLRRYISQPEEFVKIKKGKKDPIAQILGFLNPTKQEENQPFVRFPGVGTFGALSTNKNTKVLTQVIAKAHEIERKPINYSDKEIGSVMVNPSRIGVAINFGNNTDCAIVTPTVMTAQNQTIHVFKEINWNIQLQTLLFNFVRFNPKMHTQFFVITKLQAKEGNINNLIIKIDGMMGTGPQASPQPTTQTQLLTSRDIPIAKLGVNVQAAFELNNSLYQYSIAIKTFDNLDQILNNMQQLAFVTTNNIQNVANTFLTPQEVNKLKKPVTLENVAQLIDAKIDIQEPSLKDTAVQKELTEFVKEMPGTKKRSGK